MMKRLLLIQVFWMALLAGPVQAQEAPTLSDLGISLWPEFDRPDMLVIYRGRFEADTPLPLPVEIRIPAAVGSPSAVAFVGEDGGQFNQEHTTRVEGDWLVVAFELGVPAFQVEYYSPLTDQAGRREYEFAFVADYPVETLSLDVQEPPTAEEFVLAPAADAVTLEEDGLLYHRVQIDSVEQGDSRDWTISYQKADDVLTITGFTSPQPPAEASVPEVQETDQAIVWVFLIAFFCLVAVGAAAFWLGRRAQPPPPPAGATKRRGSGRGTEAQRRALSAFPGDESFHCHQCGALLRSDSEFCHKCGTAVREP
jgi:hypothetical protein